MKRWRYKHYPGYGSPKLDQEDVAVEQVTFADAGRTARLAMKLKPGFVYELTADVEAADGSALANPTAWYTLHVVPE